MNNPFTLTFLLHRPRHIATGVLLSLLLTLSGPALSGPGAHGPNGEHLDSPASTTQATGTAQPRMETHTESFELVATLQADGLSLFVDRYESNEPVQGATLEVESGPLKAAAVFRPEQGDYLVTDKALLQALAQPGPHSLVITLMAGSDGDLLEGTFGAAASPAPSTAAHAHWYDSRWAHILFTVLALLMLAALFIAARRWMRRTPQGSL